MKFWVYHLLQEDRHLKTSRPNILAWGVETEEHMHWDSCQVDPKNKLHAGSLGERILVRTQPRGSRKGEMLPGAHTSEFYRRMLLCEQASGFSVPLTWGFVSLVMIGPVAHSWRKSKLWRMDPETPFWGSWESCAVPTVPSWSWEEIRMTVKEGGKKLCPAAVHQCGLIVANIYIFVHYWQENKSCAWIYYQFILKIWHNTGSF